MSKILIVGSNGSMGKRYQAVLRYLGHAFTGMDKESPHEAIAYAAEKAAGVIICTPTDTHEDMIRLVLPARKPILCEKPVCKDVGKLRALLKEIDEADVPFRMVMQYQHLVDKNRIGKSFYDYFRTGNDGLLWDCMQILGFARGEVEIRNKSPMWSCMINGKTLSIKDMDAAYIAEVQQWLLFPRQNPGDILRIHERVEKAIVKGTQVING